MLLKILRKDFSRQKSITITLFLFITLSAFLVASGSSIIIKLIDSIENMFSASSAPHFVQMHAGEMDQTAIDRWMKDNKLVKQQQTDELVTIDGAHIFLGNSKDSEANSVMDISFVEQNGSFDFLLNLENEVIDVAQGEIGVPIYYLQKKDLEIGDKVTVTDGYFTKEFTIAFFVRDALMNPSIVHSKRFVINELDFDMLKQNIGEIEYLIEFQLTDRNKLSEFSQEYEWAQLPNTGPTIDYNSFKILNALTDGVVAVVIFLISFLLIVIALLCLRFTMLTTIEEDYQEIGVMKAIGIALNDIKRIYFVKYIVVVGLACVVGYIIAIFTTPLFTENMMLYAGATSLTLAQFLIPFLVIGLLFLLVLSFCQLVLRKFKKITAVEALRKARMGETKLTPDLMSLNKSNWLGVNIFLSFKDVFSRLKMYGLLLFVFVVAFFLITVPVNFLTTIQSPSFISYMGIGKSDLRIDLQQSDDMVQRFHDLVAYMEQDEDVEKFSPLVTSRFKVVGNDGKLESMNVETGDLSIFPLSYIEGHAPTKENEIVLSHLNAKELEKSVGDALKLLADKDGEAKEMIVTGIYQDITNGGRTAKATGLISKEHVLWYVVSLDVKSHVYIKEKLNEYKKAFHPAKLTHLEGYLDETLGEVTEQLRLLTILAISMALCLSILITSLLMKMLIVKDSSDITILRSIGFSLKDLQWQYGARVFIVLVLGIMVGTIVSNVIGESLVSALWSLIGASKIEFVIEPFFAYVLCPLIFMLSVMTTVSLSLQTIKKYNLTGLSAE